MILPGTFQCRWRQSQRFVEELTYTHKKLCHPDRSFQRRKSLAYLTLIQTLFSWVSSRMTEKPISRP